MKIALITACLAGVAHSKMAALALKKEAKKRGYDISIEEQGGHKIPGLGKNIRRNPTTFNISVVNSDRLDSNPRPNKR